MIGWTDIQPIAAYLKRGLFLYDKLSYNAYGEEVDLWSGRCKVV